MVSVSLWLGRLYLALVLFFHIAVTQIYVLLVGLIAPVTTESLDRE